MRILDLTIKVYFILLLLIIAMVAMSCNNSSNLTPGEQAKKEQASAQAVCNEWVTVTLEGCEYWIYDHGVYSITHKGNCKNPIHHYEPTY